MDNTSRNLLTIEISITDQCNLRCTYCFEQEYGYKEKMNMEQAKIIGDRIVNLSKDPKFLAQYDGLDITFWGGEPTINQKVLEYFYYRFREEVEICTFFLYTNGLTLLKYLDIIRNDDMSFQISYDGQPVHDLTRKTGNGKSTGNEVVEIFKVLAKEKIHFGIKATITPQHFHYLSAIYKDFKYLNDTIFKPNGMFQQYSPSIDYHGDLNNMNLDVFKEQMHKIAKMEIENIRAGSPDYIWSWFSSKVGGTCGAGRTMFAVDKEGSTYNCHGALYEDEPGLKEGSIFDDSFLDLIKERKENPIYEINEKCKTCASTVCSQCNIMFYTKSKKENYLDRWNDLDAHGLPLCNFYDEITKYKMSISAVLDEMNFSKV